MTSREASINDVAIDEDQRRIFGPRSKAEYGKDLPFHQPAFNIARLTVRGT
jgi:hypothetical protein